MRQRHPLLRVVKHLTSHPWQIRRHFSHAALARIEAAIADSERMHAGELRCVIESGLSLSGLLRGLTPRVRAIQLFAQLHIWDTAHNNGVLIYLNLADRDVEIVADRGIHRHVGDAGWQAICQAMEQHFRQGHFEQGVLHGVSAIGQALASVYPPEAQPRNELSNHVLLC